MSVALAAPVASALALLEAPAATVLASATPSRVLYSVLLLVVAAERAVELRISGRNTKRALQRGALELGAGHYRVMVLLHAVFLPACAAEVWLLERPFLPLLGVPCGLLLLASMALRYWVIATLGERWSTRVVYEPGRPRVVAGPYRWLRHPNYLAVAVELAALPLLHTAWLTALVFTTANALLLRTRIRVEEQALASLPEPAAGHDRPGGGRVARNGAERLAP